jgi:hypothetical protein
MKLILRPAQQSEFYMPGIGYQTKKSENGIYNGLNLYVIYERLHIYKTQTKNLFDHLNIAGMKEAGFETILVFERHQN